MKQKLLVVMYHFVMDVPAEFPSLKTLSIEKFKYQLDELCRHYQPLKMSDVRNAIVFGHDLPDNGFLLTFDHGTKDHLTVVLPELKKRSLEGSFFVMTGVLQNKKIPIVDKQRFLEGYFDDYREFYREFSQRCLAINTEIQFQVEATERNLKEAESYLSDFPFYTLHERLFRKVRDQLLSQSQYEAIFEQLFRDLLGTQENFLNEFYLNWEDVQEMAETGMSIGSHGHSHILYSESKNQACIADVQLSLKLLRERIPDQCIDTLSYPNGGFNPELFSDFEKVGLNIAFTTGCDFFSTLDQQYGISRIDTTQLKLRY